MSFRGMILGVEYVDRQEFEDAARAAGWRIGPTDRTGDWKVGLPVRFKTDGGEVLHGQVWSKGDRRGTVIVALDGGKYARVWANGGLGHLINSRGVSLDVNGKVA